MSESAITKEYALRLAKEAGFTADHYEGWEILRFATLIALARASQAQPEPPAEPRWYLSHADAITRIKELEGQIMACAEPAQDVDCNCEGFCTGVHAAQAATVQQEPVAWRYRWHPLEAEWKYMTDRPIVDKQCHSEPLYTHPDANLRITGSLATHVAIEVKLNEKMESLKAELAELKAGERGNIYYQRSLEDQLAALRAQASPDAVDARRYRWLRKADSPVGKLCSDDGLLFAGPALDAAIDAAIAAAPSPITGEKE